MTNTKKEVERAELHKTIWRIANDMRGSVDGWDFKAYVLGLLFYRFISENLTAYLNEAERKAGDTDFDYRLLSNADAEFGREETVKEKGLYVLPQDLFVNVRERARDDENLNETLSRVFTNIEASAVGADSEEDIKGLFADVDVNSGKLGPTVAKRNERLVKLLDAIGDLNFGNGGFTHNTIDAFGDAYEYLMGMYAANAGKSGGEYYTPQEVSELLARITVVGKAEVNKVYDDVVTVGAVAPSPMNWGLPPTCPRQIRQRQAVVNIMTRIAAGRSTSASCCHLLSFTGDRFRFNVRNQLKARVSAHRDLSLSQWGMEWVRLVEPWTRRTSIVDLKV